MPMIGLTNLLGKGWPKTQPGHIHAQDAISPSAATVAPSKSENQKSRTGMLPTSLVRPETIIQGK